MSLIPQVLSELGFRTARVLSKQLGFTDMLKKEKAYQMKQNVQGLKTTTASTIANSIQSPQMRVSFFFICKRE
jgi:hypothetical protein